MVAVGLLQEAIIFEIAHSRRDASGLDRRS
jgi:hypothetical protein